MATPGADVNTLVKRLTTWTNVVLLIVLALTIALVLWPSIAGATPDDPAPRPAAYQPGGVIDTPAAWHEASPFTLVLFAQANCGACQRAQPFLATLAADFAGRAPVVLVTPGGTAGDSAFGRSLGLADADMHPAPAGLRARVTPTLVLVDRTGRIRLAWEGVPPDRQPDIHAAIDRATRPD
jgi:hypothetical protein